MFPERVHPHNSEQHDVSEKCFDPFDGLGYCEPENKYYREDSVVFAEPLAIASSGNTDETSDMKNGIQNEEITLLENLTVRRRPGKRKKLYVHLHDDSSLACPLQNCNKTFSSSILLKAHIRKVHYSEKKFTCEVCGAGFSAHYLLKRHAAVHGSEKVQCPVCLKMLSSSTWLCKK